MSKKNKWEKMADEVVCLLSKKEMSANRAIGILEEAKRIVLNTAPVITPFPKKTNND